MAAKPPSNSLAIVALVLGILSFICLGPIAGIAAIVVGYLGMNKAKEMGGTGKGMATAGLILGVVGTILSIIFLFVFVFAANKASDSINDAANSAFGKADSSEYSYTVDSCKTDAFDSPVMILTVKNKTSKAKSWTFDYAFRGGSGSIVDNGTSLPQTVPANDSLQVTIDGFSEVTGSLKCEITGVNNWLN